MKPLILMLAALFIGGHLSNRLHAAEENKSRDRLIAKDTNKDGKLSREELGERFWKRVSGQDANGDGVLDEAELAALQAKGKDKRDDGGKGRPGGANAAFTVREFRASNGQTLRFSLFVPAKKQEAERLPLVLCLHGAGGNTAAANVLAASEMQQKHPCVVMAPACDGKATRWVKHEFRGGNDARAVMPELIEALDHVVAEQKVDPKRLYITGQSMGGMGTWGLIANHPEKFAAAIPVCGTWSAQEAPKMNGVAIWAFHGADDNSVPVSGSRDMIAALKKAGVKPEPRYTEFPGVGHGSWGPAYENPDLWDWLFEQRRPPIGPRVAEPPA